jgi:hypothetical protein
MNFLKPFKKFLTELNLKFPGKFPTKVKDEDIELFHSVFVEHSLEILKKDSTLWNTSRVVFNNDLSELWKDPDSHKIIWDNLQGCLFASMFHGKIDTKLKGNIPLLSTLLKSVIGERSELDDILNDESKQTNILEFLDFLKETKMASLILHIFSKLDFSQLDIQLDSFEDVQNKLEELKGNPGIIKIQNDLKTLMEEKSRTGEFTKEIILKDIESIKLKVQEIFGNVFNDILGTRKSEVSSKTLLDNSPEARKERMIARLRRKLKDKK